MTSCDPPLRVAEGGHTFGGELYGRVKAIAPGAPKDSALRFSEMANWLAPGHLMVSRYPMLKAKKERLPVAWKPRVS